MTKLNNKSNLPELIEACGEDFMLTNECGKWEAWKGYKNSCLRMGETGGKYEADGKTPKESILKLLNLINTVQQDKLKILGVFDRFKNIYKHQYPYIDVEIKIDLPTEKYNFFTTNIRLSSVSGKGVSLVMCTLIPITNVKQFCSHGYNSLFNNLSSKIQETIYKNTFDL